MDKFHTGWRRLFAAWIDGILLSLLCDAISWAIGLNLNIVLNAILAVAYSSIGIAYSVYMHGRFGQTFGKYFARVKVLNLNGGQISYEQALLRDIVPCLILPISIWTSLYILFVREMPHQASIQWVYPIAYIWVSLELFTMLLNEKRRAIHDYIARTIVVRVS